MDAPGIRVALEQLVSFCLMFNIFIQFKFVNRVEFEFVEKNQRSLVQKLVLSKDAKSNSFKSLRTFDLVVSSPVLTSIMKSKKFKFVI